MTQRSIARAATTKAANAAQRPGVPMVSNMKLSPRFGCS